MASPHSRSCTKSRLITKAFGVLDLSRSTDPNFKICGEGMQTENKTARTWLYSAKWLQRQMILCEPATARSAVLSLPFPTGHPISDA